MTITSIELISKRYSQWMMTTKLWGSEGHVGEYRRLVDRIRDSIGEFWQFGSPETIAIPSTAFSAYPLRPRVALAQSFCLFKNKYFAAHEMISVALHVIPRTPAIINSRLLAMRFICNLNIRPISNPSILIQINNLLSVFNCIAATNGRSSLFRMLIVHVNWLVAVGFAYKSFVGYHFHRLTNGLFLWF